MGASAVAATAGGGLMLGTSLLQFQQQRSAAEIQSAEAETSAQQEELGATAREADRKGRLAAALASQNAQAGAKGIAAFEGSPLAILEADISAEKEATQRDVFMSKLSAEATRSGAKVKERFMKTGASIGLLSDLGTMAFKGGMAARG